MILPPSWPPPSLRVMSFGADLTPWAQLGIDVVALKIVVRKAYSPAPWYALPPDFVMRLTLMPRLGVSAPFALVWTRASSIALKL